MVDIGMNVARLQQDARRATSIIESSTRQMTSSLNTFKNMAVAALTFSGASAALGAFTAYNKEMETAKIGIASLLVAQGKFTDSQGNMLQGTNQIAAAYKLTSGIMKQLEKDNLATTATFGELRKAFQMALGPGLAANLGLDQIRQFSVAMMQAGAAMSVPMDQMGQEVRSILSGDITGDSIIAKNLQITPADIKALKGNTDEFFKFLMDKVKAFKEFGAETQNTYEGLISNVSDKFQEAMGVGTQPFFDELKKRLVSVNEYLVRTNAQTGQMELNPQFMRDVEALNTLLIGILDIASAIGEVFTKVVIPPIRSAIEAFSSLKDMTGKTGFTGGGLESFGSGSMTVAGTDVQAMKSAADEYISKIREAQEIIDRWSAGGSAGKFLGMFQILNAEFDVSRYTAGLESIQKHLKEQGQDTQELERFIASLKNEMSDYARDGADAAANSTEQFSYKANEAGVSADELKKRLQDLKAQFKDLESAQTAASGAIGKNLESAQFQKMALDKGWDSGRTGIEKQRQEELRYMARFQDESRKAGISPRETEAYTKQMEENSKLAYEISLSNKAREEALKEAKKKTPVFEGSDRQAESYKRAIMDTFGEITAQSRDNAEEMKRNSGAFYDAERIRIQGWVDDTKRAFQDRVDSIGASIKDMWDSIAEAQGRGDIIPPETYASVQELQKMFDSLKEQVPSANKEIEESAQIHLEQFKKISSIQGELDLAQVNVSYAELTKTMQDQYQAQVALINATEAETLAHANEDIPGLVDAYKELYKEQRRIAMLKATGSYFEGMTEGAREIQNSIPTAFENGITAVNAFHDALNSASDAFVEMAFEGKASFGDLVTSMLKDLAKLAMRQATQGFFSSVVGGIAGWAGSLFGGGKASGGSVRPYTSYLVGEKGPELLTMGASGGFISPNGSGGGNISVPVQMTVSLVSNGGSSEDPSQGQQIGEAAAKAFRSEVIRIIQDQTRPGNALNRGLRG